MLNSHGTVQLQPVCAGTGRGVEESKYKIQRGHHEMGELGEVFERILGRAGARAFSEYGVMALRLYSSHASFSFMSLNSYGMPSKKSRARGVVSNAWTS